MKLKRSILPITLAVFALASCQLKKTSTTTKSTPVESSVVAKPSQTPTTKPTKPTTTVGKTSTGSTESGTTTTGVKPTTTTPTTSPKPTQTNPITTGGESSTNIEIGPFASGSYYSSLSTSTTPNTLVNELSSLANKSDVKVLDYGDLWEAYKTTDIKPGTNIIWDMYSNTNYIAGDKYFQGTTISGEGSSYNREHGCCQSWFASNYPMESDLFHVYPVDGYSNTQRNDNPYGEVDLTKTITYTSSNGSKLGQSKLAGFEGVVWEPIDQYKGDLARSYFFLAMRYKDDFKNWPQDKTGMKLIFKTEYPYLTDYAMDLFTRWSHLDPVSDKEIARNEAVYSIQNNRNPFIDHPEWIDTIWTNEYKDVEYTVDSDKVSNVETLIAAIPAVEELSYSNRNLVFAANDAYLLLNPKEQQAVSTYEKLATALDTVKDLMEPDPGTVTYYLTSKDAFATSGDVPRSSTAKYNTTSSANSTGQLTKDNVMTLTLDGYGGTTIKGLSLHMKSNKTSGSAYLIVQAGDTVLASIGSKSSGVAYSNAKWNGSYSGTWNYVTVKDFNETLIPAGETITITIGATANSIYCDKFSLDVEDERTTSAIIENQGMNVSMKADYTLSSMKYDLVTDASTLAEDDVIIIAAKNANVAMSNNQKTNNRGCAPITKSGTVASVSDVTVQEFVLKKGTTDGTWAFYDSNLGYLTINGSTKNNYMVSNKTLSANGSWTIVCDSTGKATVTAQGDKPNTLMCYGSSLFSSYQPTKPQSDIAIYKKTDKTQTIGYDFSGYHYTFLESISSEVVNEYIEGGTLVSYGIEVSTDGESYTSYSVTSTTASGFVNWSKTIDIAEENLNTPIYARAYIEVDGVKIYTAVRVVNPNDVFLATYPTATYPRG